MAMFNLKFKAAVSDVLDGIYTIVAYCGKVWKYNKDGSREQVDGPFVDYPTGTSYSNEAVVVFWYKVLETGDIKSRTLRLYDDKDKTVAGEDGLPEKVTCAQNKFRNEVRRAIHCPNATIDQCIETLGNPKNKFKAQITQMKRETEDGEQVRDEFGNPVYNTAMWLIDPDYQVKMPEAEPERAAEAEAERAKKNARKAGKHTAYAGSAAE